MAVMDMTAGGLPLVSSDRTPYAVYIKERADAARVIPMGEGEVGMYADALRELIDDPEGARKIAKRGNEAAQEFDWPRLTRRFVSEIEGMFDSK